MSATLRYDIGVNAERAVRAMFKGRLLEALGCAEVRRWKGHAKGGRKPAYTFAVKLPSQVAMAWELLGVAADLCAHADGLTRLSGQSLRKKLSLALGMPGPDNYFGTEEMFLVPVRASPGDMANWSAWADWLQEKPDSVLRRRGLVMAGWLVPGRPVKVKYGVPVLATDEKIQC